MLAHILQLICGTFGNSKWFNPTHCVRYSMKIDSVLLLLYELKIQYMLVNILCQICGTFGH